MDSATAIAQGIHATDGKSAYDRACKRLLSQKIILAWILKSCVDEFRGLDVNDIAEKYIEGTPTMGQEPVANYDLLSIIMIRLGGPEADHYDGILKLLHTLLSNETSETEKRTVLESEFQIPMSHEIEREVSSMCNLSEVVEESGIQKGLQKGRQEGRQEERLFALKTLMKNMKMSIEQALVTLEIPEGDWPEYRRLLAEQ